MSQRGFLLLLGVLLAVLAASPAAAHTVVPIQPPPGRGGPPEIRLRSLQVQAEVDRGVAQVRVDQVFVNQGSTPAEGTYLFPLPHGASVSSFQMFLDGQAYTGEVLDAGKAREIYEGIVRRNRDPALLQYVGQGLLQARIFPVPAGAERRIRIEYSQVLHRETGLSELVVPIGPEAVPQASVTVRLLQPGPTIYSPTHDVAVTRDSGGAARVSFESAGAWGDFRLLFGGEEDGIGVSLLTYRPSGEDGYFILLASPPAGANSQAEVIAKDVILAVDLSGSMQGEKFEQAKGAALQVLDSLGADDRFAVIGFHSDVTAYADGLRPASEAGPAMDWVRGLRVGGSTNISGAMEQMQRMAGRPDGRPQTLLLITDGQPTVGEQDPDRIVSAVQARVTGAQRIFAFGVGYDVNTRLLDEMARENRGKSDYVKPGENLESAVAALWRKVGQPVLSDVKLQWGGVTVEEVYPRQVPDLYLGSQMVLLGRYRGSGAGSLSIQGEVNGRTRSFDFTGLEFTARAADGRDYIPRLWANRKVAYLLSEARLHGTNQEVLEEIVSLAQRYGIVTPYTSFFINEPTTVPIGSRPGAPPAAPAPMPAPEAARKTAQAMQRAAAAPSGAAAVNTSSQMGRMLDATSLAETQAMGSDADRIRTAGEKTFVLRQGIWVDTAYKGGPLTQLKLGSDKYLELLHKRPDLAKFFAAGTPLVVTEGAVTFAVDYPGAEETAGDLPGSVTSPPAPGGGGGGGNLVSAARSGETAAWVGAVFLVAAGGAVFWQFHRRTANKAS